MNKVASLTWYNLSLLFATGLLSFATAHGLFWQSPSKQPADFSVLEPFCWLYPCLIKGLPNNFWERHGIAVLVSNVAAFEVDERGTMVVADRYHRVTSFGSELQPILDVALPASSLITAITVQGESTLVTAHHDSSTRESTVRRWDSNGNPLSWDNLDFPLYEAPSHSTLPITDLAATDDERILILHADEKDWRADISDKKDSSGFYPISYELANTSTPPPTISAVAISSHGWLLTGHSDGRVQIWSKDQHNRDHLETISPLNTRNDDKGVLAIAEISRGTIAIEYRNGVIMPFNNYDKKAGVILAWR